MEIIRQKAYARAGLIGNPSDGYNGKTISVTLRNFYATVTLYEWNEIEIIMTQNDNSRFRSVEDLVLDVQLHGYYGGIRLIKATIKRFVEYCKKMGYPLHDRTFSIRYETNIPRQVGMAGSSAIIVATLRCLMDFYHIQIPQHLQPSLVLSVEEGELGITAGLQDRVIQVYEGMVYMDFTSEKMQEENGLRYGKYESLPSSETPPIYVAYKYEAGEPTEIVHNNLRHLWNTGDAKVHAAMKRFAEITDEAKIALKNHDWKTLSQLMDDNFSLRRSICQISSKQLEMIEVAKSMGVSAKFVGSGGAILGICPQDETSFQNLCQALEKIHCKVFRPQIFPPAPIPE
ncbi:MAG: GHMP kinase [Planctomycetia bacterium]|nr:GHMP kinase [Planctomycetia bacterium]